MINNALVMVMFVLVWKKKINISTIDSMVLLGPNDQNIKLVEQAFNSKIVVRGDYIFIEGNKEELDFIASSNKTGSWNHLKSHLAHWTFLPFGFNSTELTKYFELQEEQ